MFAFTWIGEEDRCCNSSHRDNSEEDVFWQPL